MNNPIDNIFDNMNLSDDYENYGGVSHGLILGVEAESIRFNLRCECGNYWRLDVYARLYRWPMSSEWARGRIQGDIVDAINRAHTEAVETEVASFDCYADDALASLCDLIPKIRDAWNKAMEEHKDDPKFYVGP